MASGMEIRIIEVPSGSKQSTLIESTPSQTKERIATELSEKMREDVQNGGDLYTRITSMTDFKSKLNDSLNKAINKKNSSTKASVAALKNLKTDATSQGSSSGGSSVSSAIAAGAIIEGAGMVLDTGMNAASALFDNLTIGESWGKYGGNQVALRKAENVKNTISGAAEIGGSTLKGVNIGLRVGQMFGPTGMAIGAAAGAVAGLALGVANKALENSRIAKEIAMKQAEWNAESKKTLDRLGYNGGR